MTNYSNIWIVRIICPNAGPAPASATHASLQVYADLALVTLAHNRLEHHNQHHRITSRLTWCGFITWSWESQSYLPKIRIWINYRDDRWIYLYKTISIISSSKSISLLDFELLLDIEDNSRANKSMSDFLITDDSKNFKYLFFVRNGV